jgi:RHS repeat-associated protein
VISDDQNRIRWEWDGNDPFGNNAPNEDPSGLGAFHYNLRFPGQYFDSETGLSYNYFRDYDPSIGRYVESDPIGLAGGTSTYGYVNGNSLVYVDPYGLVWLPDAPDWLVNGAAGFGDDLSFGLTRVARRYLGGDASVNVCSTAYKAGTWTGVGLSLAFGGAHLGRAALNQMGKGGLKVGLKRLLSDPRRWSSVQRSWSNSVGGYKGEYELHHWFQPQSLGGSNAAWNYVPVTPWLNNAMGQGGLLYNSFKASVLGIYGAIPTSAIESAEDDCSCAGSK